MKNCQESLLNNLFSHIYIENAAADYSLVSKIVNRFKDSKIIRIDHYKDVFCKKNQNFVVQKKSPKLILAVNRDKFLYEGSDMCNHFGNDNFYYTSHMMNCFYDCEYCYLQGMYPSANVVIFVNIDEQMNQIEKILDEKELYICISYDTDLLAFEDLTGFVARWIQLAHQYDRLKIEIRTKSANFNAIKEVEAKDNIILAWTLSPNEIIEKFEHGTPSLDNRLANISQALALGWKVRICFDPVLYVEGWKLYYENCINKVFEVVDGNRINDVSLGVFRVSLDYLKKMSKLRPCSEALAYHFGASGSYSETHQKEMMEYIKELLMSYMQENKIFLY